MTSVPLPLASLEVPLERDQFFRTMLRELAGALDDVIGLEQAEGFVSVVGQRLGDEIDAEYRRAMSQRTLRRDQVADVLVDLKRRLGGGFSVESQDEHRIVLQNTVCPFGDLVRDRPALCMMTSNVFGTIVAANLGYARVLLERTIARGDGGCRVVVELHAAASEASLLGREYFAR